MSNSTRQHASMRGFTLLEIMVVIVIVGVIATYMAISIGVLGRDREMQDQAERIWAVLNQAKEECELQGIDVGLRLGAHSYDFLRFDPREQLWLPITDDDLMVARDLPEGLRFRLWLEGREVVLKENLQSEDSDSDSKAGATTKQKAATQNGDAQSADKQATDKQTTDGLTNDNDAKRKERPPQIMVLSSGDLNSFELQLERDGGDTRWKVASQPDNSVKAEQISDEG